MNIASSRGEAPRFRLETVDLLVCGVATACAVAGYLLYYDLVTTLVY